MSLIKTHDFAICAVNRIDQLFVDSFNELGLQQCALEPTHIKGRTLDILLTNQRPLISHIEVHKFSQICKSDHHPVCFKVKVLTKYRPPTKRKLYNFKQAGWRQLIGDIAKVPWSALIDSRDPESAWKNFKTVFFALVDKHVCPR